MITEKICFCVYFDPNTFPPQSMSTKLSPELSDLVVYCQSVPFSGFETASQRPPSMMSSFSENEALKLIKDSGEVNRKIICYTFTYTKSTEPLQMWQVIDR